MSKSFSEREREIIHENLINACKECWNRYGYHKTGIREIAEIAGISSGAFYQFFASKELLFVETAQTCEKEFEDIFRANMENQPNKSGLAQSLKAIAVAMQSTPWLNATLDEWAVILRKLPPDYLKQDMAKDVNRVARYVEQYGLKPRRSIEEVTQIVDILLASVWHVNVVPGDASASIHFIFGAVVDQLFE